MVKRKGTMEGMIPKALHKVWSKIPSAADIAVTGKLSASPREYDMQKARKEANIPKRAKAANLTRTHAIGKMLKGMDKRKK